MIKKFHIQESKRKISQQQLTDILKTIGKKPDFIEYANKHGKKNYIREIFSPYDLTHGFCNPLAYYIKDNYSGITVYSAKNDIDGNHLFVELGGKYFDGTDIHGVDNPQDLSFFTSKQNISLKFLESNNQKFVIESIYPADYKAWKRKNVTIRGVAEMGSENGGGAMLGDGLYTAFLSNKELAKQYGTVNFVINAIPKKPLTFNTLNDWEIWVQRNLFPKDDSGHPSLRNFFAQGKTYASEIQKLGYDGVIIKGREMVNYAPGDVLYFQNERQLYNYWEIIIQND